MSSRYSWAVRGAVSGAFALTLLAASSALAQTNDTPSNDATPGDSDASPTPQAAPPKAPQSVTAPQNSTTPAFLVTGLGAVSETYTTNVNGVANNTATDGDFDSRLQLQLNALEHTADLTAAFNYSGQFDYFARESSAPVISTDVTGLVDYRAIPEYLRFDLRVFAQPVLLNPLGAVTAPGSTLPQGANANISDTYGFSFAPTLTFRLGSFATSTLTPSYGTVWFVRPSGAPDTAAVLAGTAPPPMLSTASVIEKITSGNDFSRVYWQLLGSDLEQNQEALGLKQREGTADFEYAITREFILLMTGGYQSVDTSTALSQNLNGPIAYAGLRVKFSNQSMIEFRAGEEDNSASYIGDATITMSHTTTFTGMLDDTIQTPAGRLLGSLSDLDVDVQNNGSFQFYNNQYTAPGVSPTNLTAFNAVPLDGLAFNNAIERFRSGTATLTHKFADSTQVSLIGYGTIADILSAVPAGESRRQTSGGLSLQGTRAVSPDLTLNLNISCGDQYISTGSDEYVSVAASASYNLSRTLAAFAQVGYFTRISSESLSAAIPQAGTADVATFTIGIQKTF